MAEKKPKRTPLRERDDFAQIEYELAVGASITALSRKYDIEPTTLKRHRKRLPPQLKAAFVGHLLAPGEDLENLKVQESEALLQSLGQQRARLVMMQTEAMAKGEYQAAATLGHAIVRVAETIGKYLDVLHTNTRVTVTNYTTSLDYLKLRAMMMKVLEAFPEAKEAVSLALYDMESSIAENIARPVIDVTPAAPLAIEEQKK